MGFFPTARVRSMLPRALSSLAVTASGVWPPPKRNATHVSTEYFACGLNGWTAKSTSARPVEGITRPTDPEEKICWLWMSVWGRPVRKGVPAVTRPS